ncbi:MAG: hypothetical protein HKN03_08330 [Acidimicrobiales bacterium]|nr:hypothetical protein [Acidimicrobiales bacterium]
MFQSSIERRLRNVGGEIIGLRNELRVLEEQLAHFADEADDARLRSLVSETPLAGREHRDASRTVAALQRDRVVKVERLGKLEQKQDSLLDELNTRKNQ